MTLSAARTHRRAVVAPTVLVAAALLLGGCAAQTADHSGSAGISRSVVVDPVGGSRPAVPNSVLLTSAGSTASLLANSAGPIAPVGPATAPMSSAGPMPSAGTTSAVTRTAERTNSTPPAPVPVFGTPGTPIQVQVTGLMLADDKGLVVMCPPAAGFGIEPASPEPATPNCWDPIPVTKADIAKVSQPDHNATHRWGQTHIEGSWDGTQLTARSQRLPSDADRDSLDQLLEGVPCPAPADGWRVGGVQDDPGVQKIRAAVGPDFGALAMGYPHGRPADTVGTSTSIALQNTEQVLVVGVTGDIARATTAIRAVFTGNLCVVRSSSTATEIARQTERLLAALGKDWRRDGVMMTGGGQDRLGDVSTHIDVVVDTPELHRLLAGVKGPPIVIDAWITPVQ